MYVVESIRRRSTEIQEALTIVRDDLVLGIDRGSHVDTKERMIHIFKNPSSVQRMPIDKKEIDGAVALVGEDLESKFKEYEEYIEFKE